MTRLPTIEELRNDPVEVRARQAAERGDMKILSLHEVEQALRTGSPLDPDHYVAWPTPDDGFCQQIGTYLEELRNGKELERMVKPVETPVVKQLSTAFGSLIPAVEWDDKGRPFLKSILYLDMYPKIRSELEDRLTASEIELLDGRKLAAEKFPQVKFNKTSAKVFENLCLRAKIACPFHIGPDNA